MTSSDEKGNLMRWKRAFSQVPTELWNVTRFVHFVKINSLLKIVYHACHKLTDSGQHCESGPTSGPISGSPHYLGLMEMHSPTHQVSCNRFIWIQIQYFRCLSVCSLILYLILHFSWRSLCLQNMFLWNTILHIECLNMLIWWRFFLFLRPFGFCVFLFCPAKNPEWMFGTISQ